MSIDQRLLQADQAGVRLEIIGGLPVWEFHPVRRHQRAIDRIRASIRQTAPTDGNGCGCVHEADIYIKFPDGSLKRPDISIFCREPLEEDEAVTMLPEAVVEVVSPGYEAKDMELAPHFYLSHGVKDVIIFDPFTLVVLHIRKEGATRLVSPANIKLECGCACIV